MTTANLTKCATEHDLGERLDCETRHGDYYFAYECSCGKEWREEKVLANAAGREHVEMMLDDDAFDEWDA